MTAVKARGHGAPRNCDCVVLSITRRAITAAIVPAFRTAAGDAAAPLGLPAPVIAQAIAHSNLVAIRARAARPALEAVFRAVAEALAWVLIAVAGLILVEHALVHPVRAEFERWRDAARPWGVKR